MPADGEGDDDKAECRVTLRFGKGAVNEARTRDPQLGKLMLYQLSYYRILLQTDSGLRLQI